MDIYEKTGGLFDLTIYPLMELWGFPQRNIMYRQRKSWKGPAAVDASKISFTGDEVYLGEGQQVDFGGIAKGYTFRQGDGGFIRSMASLPVWYRLVKCTGIP